MPIIIILSEEDRDKIVKVLHLWASGARLAELFEKAPSEHTVRIIIHDGMVEHVENMPMGFNYEVQNFDNCRECGEVEPYCEWCKEDRNEL